MQKKAPCAIVNAFLRNARLFPLRHHPEVSRADLFLHAISIRAIKKRNETKGNSDGIQIQKVPGIDDDNVNILLFSCAGTSEAKKKIKYAALTLGLTITLPSLFHQKS